MASKNIRDQKSSTHNKPAKGRGEIKDSELDKVSGGMKPVGGKFVGKGSTFTEDPCAGGE